MASNAYQEQIEALLGDADEIIQAHTRLRTGQRGRQWGLGALNRSVVVISVSAWEAYIESVVVESVSAIRPPNAPLGVWPALNATVRSQVGRFNNPNPAKVQDLIATTIGLQDIQESWRWRGCTSAVATAKLGEALQLRHKIAHGTNPRPVVHNGYASWLPNFLRRLAQRTDDAIRTYIQVDLGINEPWPA